MGSVDRRGRESEMLIEGAGFLVLGLNHQGTRGDDGLCLQVALERILQQACTQPHALLCRVNGEPRQKGDLADLIWNVAETIEHLSAAWTLQPGDLIYSGTPAGVNAVVRGDVMEGAIAGLGTLRVAVR